MPVHRTTRSDYTASTVKYRANPIARPPDAGLRPGTHRPVKFEAHGTSRPAERTVRIIWVRAGETDYSARGLVQVRDIHP